MDCLCCKIIAGEAPCARVWEDEYCYAFKDIAPQAPVHVLIVPKEHISGVDCITVKNSAVVAHIFSIIPWIAAELGIRDGGYRVVSNVGENGCQSVRHLHFHILGGEKLSDRMA